MSIDRDRARSAAESERRRPARQPDAPRVCDWLHIAADNSVAVYTGKTEVGQNIRTSLAQAVADELCVPLESISMLLADTDRTPYDPGTFGSQTTPIMAQRLRRVAASARELLLDRAAALWQVERQALRIAAGTISDRQTGRSISFGQLTRGQPISEPYREDAPITPPAQWSIAGSPQRKIDGRAMVTGQHRYTPDLALPKMLIGQVLRPPAYRATLTALDPSAAGALPGVHVIRDGDFVGVVAPDRRSAAQAIAALRAEWSVPGQIGSSELIEFLRTHPAPPSDDPRAAPQHEECGSIEDGYRGAAHVLRASYSHAYIAHAPLEPRAALAEWRDGRLTVWTGTQRPFGVRDELARAFDLPESAIRVIVPDTGSAYGGKHTGEAAIEAARMARAVEQPVKLIWTREEEFAWAYLRPAGVVDISAAVQADGTISAWEFDTYNAGAAGMRTPYAVTNQRVAYHPTETPLRQGSYRALAATAHTFARERHIDQLAHLAGRDPLEFRLRNLDDPRMRAVLEAAAGRFGWTRAPATNHGYGIACGTEKGSYVAACAEVAIDPASGQMRVVRVVQAFECGAIVNPDGLRNQVEGAIVQGLGGALFEAIAFEHGRIVTDRFSRYRVPRFADVPPIEVVLLDRPDLESAGAGETPIIAVAPAIGNALAAASGQQPTRLPLSATEIPAPGDPA